MTKTIYKIAVVGDGGCGKSSLIRAKTEKNFTERSEITIGVDFACIPFEIGEQDLESNEFLAMDLGGQPRFHFIHDSYIKGIKGAVVLYDVSRYRSFTNLAKWFQLLHEENPKIPIFLVGSKMDLVDADKIDFYREEWKNLQKSIPNSNFVCSHTFISSKTMVGIEDLFRDCEKSMTSQA